MNSGLGGASGYGENSYTTLGPDVGNLDDGSVFVDITSVFGGSGINYFGTDYTGLYINSNGLLTFGAAETAYDPQGLANYDKPAIVPFWTDVDVSKGGDILWDLDPTAGTFTVTWLGVAPYSGSGVNSFQVVMTDTGGGNFDIEFIYEDIQYTDGYAGDATGGVSDGNGHIYELEGSGNGSVLADYETNDFDGGDPIGTYHMSVVNGFPDAIVVDGTSGDDAMGLGYVDAEGQEITTSDDYIDAGDGNDTVDGDKGDDTILGGAGDDVIYSGSHEGASAPTYTTVNNGDNFNGTTGQDFFRWTAATGSAATIRFNNSAGAGDGDGEADYVLVDSKNDTGTLTIGDFDVGIDRIVLPEAYTSISISTTAGQADITITYSNGNQQHFRIYHDDSQPISASAIFTTEAPTATISDNDVLDGGDGNDTFILEDQFGQDTILGGAGEGDHIDASGLSGPITVTFTGSEDGTLTDGTDTITFDNIEELTLTDQADLLDASASAADVWVDAGDGDDTVIGSSDADTIIGGLGDDSITGGGGDDLLVLTTSGGRDTVTDFDLNDDDTNGFFNDQLDVSDLTGGTGPGGIVTTDDVVVSDDGSGNALLTFPGGEQLVLQGVTPAQMSGQANLYAAGIPCFTAGQQIETQSGPRAVEALRPGDMVQTADNGYQPVLWVGLSHVTPHQMMSNPRLRPVTLMAGGPLELPRPMRVSRQHRFVWRLGVEELFVRANQLAHTAPRHAVASCPTSPITYVHLLLPRHEVIFVDGVASESFYPGPWSLRGLLPEVRQEVLALFPALTRLAGVHPKLARQLTESCYGALARQEIKTQRLRVLLASLHPQETEHPPAQKCRTLWFDPRAARQLRDGTPLR